MILDVIALRFKTFFNMKLYTFILVLLLTTSCRVTKNNMNNLKLSTLSVKGRNIINSNGIPVSFAGNSFFWSNNYWSGHHFYNAEVVNWLKTDWKSTIVRCAVAADEDIKGGYFDDKEANLKRIDAVIDAAIANNMYVIIDWHSHHAHLQTQEAIAFFTRMATKYGKYPNVIYEIYNEPLKVSWHTVIKPYAEKVIAAIRKIDPDNLIVVGTPNWSQDVDIAAENPITNYKNIAYTLHFYAASHKDKLRAKAQLAIDKGLPIFVTEWGTVKANGGGNVAAISTQKWMQFLKKYHISHCNWSVNDKDEGASILKPKANKTGYWKEEDLTPSGKLVRQIIRNWNEQ